MLASPQQKRHLCPMSDPHPPTSFGQPIVFGNKEPTSTGADPEPRNTWHAIKHGIAKRCPQCGKGKIFDGFLKVHDTCSFCELELIGHQADDAPPYFTILITGHLVFPLVVALKIAADPPMWFQYALWGTVLVGLIWYLLPTTKGALIALQWAKKMHGFADTPQTDLEETIQA